MTGGFVHLHNAEYRPYPKDPGYLVGDDGTMIGVSGRPLRLTPDSRGYVLVPFRGGREYLHAAVLMTFVGPRPSPRHEGAHWNGNPSDNALCNLRWATPEENWNDRFRHGRARVLSENDALQIIKRIMDCEYPDDLAAEYGVKLGSIQAIVAGRSFKHLPRPDGFGTRKRRRSGVRKLEPTDVVSIRAKLANGASQRSIAAEYGVSQTQVSAIKRGLIYADVRMGNV